MNGLSFRNSIIVFSTLVCESVELKANLIFLISFAANTIFLKANSQSETGNKMPVIGVLIGMMNYQGDLKPDNFTFKHSNFVFSFNIKQPLNNRISWRTGFSIGKIEGADRYNRDYLKIRNLSFYSDIWEVYTGFELAALDISAKRFTPYVYAGISVFHFNPWTYDRSGRKQYLQPLGTEGQGLAKYPQSKPYKLTQFSLPFGIGLKYAINDQINIGVELSQRKTFTDYLDDVSTSYPDYNTLLQARGPQAVALSYRGDEIPGGSPYPRAGEQRGTPTNKDWYYFAGVMAEFKWSMLHQIFNRPVFNNSQTRCPHF
jgi:hypothetical protein